MRVSELIEILESVKSSTGDVEVFVISDPENSEDGRPMSEPFALEFQPENYLLLADAFSAKEIES